MSGGWAVTGPSRDDLQVSARLDLQAGDAADPLVAWPGFSPAGGQQTPWRKLGLDVTAVWNAAPRTRLDLSAGHDLEVQSVLPAGQGSATRNDHGETFTDLKLETALDHGLRFDLSGRVKAVDDAIDDPQEAGGTMQLHTAESAGGAALRWDPSTRLSFDAGAELGYAELDWRNLGQTRQGYASAEPRLDAVLTPWSGGRWTLSYGRSATPVDLGAFVAVAESLQRAGGGQTIAGLAPSREWRTQARFSQTLPGSGALNVAVTQARLESVTELTRNIAGVDLPGTVNGGSRRQVDAALSLPLAAVGLKGVSVETAGAVRRSEIVDPVTGTPRRLSGEAPYDAHLTLVQEVRAAPVRWGLQANAQGAQVSYTPEEVATAAQTRTLGMFVEYRPPAFALRLQVDGLAGAEREFYDTYYDGARAAGRIGRTDQHTEGGPGFSLVLRRAL